MTAGSDDLSRCYEPREAALPLDLVRIVIEVLAARWFIAVSTTTAGTVAALSRSNRGRKSEDTGEVVSRGAMTPDLVIRGAVLVRPPFDATTRRFDVAIGGERLIAIVDSDSVAWPEATAVVDGRDGFLMPGLIDAHAHLTGSAIRIAPALRAYLEHGVTTVREAGAHDDAAFDLVRARTGRLPRILSAGWMLTPAKRSGGTTMTEIAEEAVRAGSSWLKAYALPPEDVRAVAEVARHHGLPVAAHLGSAAIESVRTADLPAIEHVFSLLDHDLIDARTRRHARIPPSDRPIETWLLADASEAPLRDWIAELAARRVTVTPTLTVMAPLVGRSPGTLDAIAADEVPWATADERSAWRERLKGFGWWIAPGPASRARRRRVLERFGEIVQSLHAAGAPIAAGTDLGEPFIEPGRGLIGELRALVAAGLSHAAVLGSATSVPAALLGRSADLGDVTVGGMADLLLLDDDPRRSLDAFDHIRFVVGAGRMIETGESPALRLSSATSGDPA
jgi:imidazolonepropionase-like amidohydrolase